ncbi:MAG: hemerythrin family protein [Rubrivivax sp.]|nr:hemerythrin family protein [Rubrivivax sp.]
MTILWRPAMAVGDATIDADHQSLIEIINTVELTLQASGGNAELGTTLDQLAIYAKEHFEREESLMRRLGYGGLASHHQAHRELREELGRIRVAIEAAKTEAVPAEEMDRLVKLLRSWLLDHLLKEDMLLKAFLKSVS